LGVVITPTALPGLDISVDWLRTRINGAPIGFSPFDVFFGCLFGDISAFCSRFHRDPSTGVLDFVDSTIFNGLSHEAESVNVDVSYTLALQDGLGGLEVAFLGARYLKDQYNFTDGVNFDCSGLFGGTCGPPVPDWQHRLRLTWNSPWNASFAMQWRHIGAADLDQNSSQPFLAGPLNSADAHAPAVNYFDVSGVWRPTPDLEVRAAINNIFDRDPPSFAQNVAFDNNSYAGVYDFLGRTFYVSVGKAF
jgi:outer membrane receptor protein involved in Fe transport